MKRSEEKVICELDHYYVSDIRKRQGLRRRSNRDAGAGGRHGYLIRLCDLFWYREMT